MREYRIKTIRVRDHAGNSAAQKICELLKIFTRMEKAPHMSNHSACKIAFGNSPHKKQLIARVEMENENIN